MSKGEELIKHYLDKKGIKYSQEKPVFDTGLRFDFYLEDLNIVIEFQGKQHYEPVAHYGGYGTFRKQQHRDEKKRLYCREYCIGLIEIPYYVPDIIDFLERRMELINVWRKKPN